jgi:hypothetical protein
MGYILVNPVISNSGIKSSKKNSIEAAEDIWSKLSANIKNYTPKFYFTIQDGGSSKLSHFVIKESLEDSRVKYNLKEFKGKKIDEKTLINELKQQGGKRRKHRKYDDDSSSSSSSSSSELVFTFPTGKSPNLMMTYYPSIYGVSNVILPTFVSSYAPFVNMKLTTNPYFVVIK